MTNKTLKVSVNGSPVGGIHPTGEIAFPVQFPTDSTFQAGRISDKIESGKNLKDTKSSRKKIGNAIIIFPHDSLRNCFIDLLCMRKQALVNTIGA